MITYLLNVAELTTVAAERNTTILNEAGGCKTLEVLVLVLRPTLSHLRTAGLVGELSGKNKLTFWIADHVDNGHIDGNVLLEGDKKDGKTILAKSGLDIGEGEVVDNCSSISLETGTEAVQIPLLGCINKLGPSLFSLELRDTGPVDKATLLTLESLVPFLVTELASHRIGGAVASGVAIYTTSVAGTGEFALNARVGAVGLVVTNFAAVEALASEAASGGLVGALSSEVTGLVATANGVSMVN